jgi:endonuclease YncB( thermonuclease family)
MGSDAKLPGQRGARAGLLRLGLAALLGLALAGPAAVLAAPPRAEEPWSGKVTAIEDAATLEIAHGGKGERLRLAGVAPPEADQPWGRQAKEFVKENALGQVVTVEPQGVDHKQRPLAHIILPDGRDLGAEMVKEGLAWHYRRWSKNPLLGDLEKDARDERRGLWQDPKPVPPWEWRSKGGTGQEESSSKSKRKRR